MACLEVERVRDLFRALGDLHMLVFGVLYKNPHILQPSPMFVLEEEGRIIAVVSGGQQAREPGLPSSGCSTWTFCWQSRLKKVVTVEEDR